MDVTRNMVIRISEQGATETAATMNRVDEAQRRIQSSAQRMGAQMGGVAVQSRQANTALINMSRVVQDLPYGFIGIANNIDPLILSFRQLQAEAAASGGKVSAFGTILRTIASPSGALILGVSAITSLILLGPKLKDLFGGINQDALQAADRVRALNEEWTKFLSSSRQISPSGQVGVISTSIAAMEAEARALLTKSEELQRKIDEIRQQAAAPLSPGAFAVQGVPFFSGALSDLEKELFEATEKRRSLLLEINKLKDEEVDKTEKLADDERKIREEVESFGFQEDPIEKRLFWRKFERDLEDEINDAYDKQIRKLEEQRKKSRDNVDIEKESLRALHSSVSAVSALRSGLSGLTSETGNWLDKLISAVQTLTAIYELISAIRLITNIASFGASGAGEAVTEGIGDAVTGRAGGGGPAFQGTTVVIQAMDSQSLDQFLRSPSNRKRLADNINEIVRKGR